MNALELHVNGRARRVETDPESDLLGVIRGGLPIASADGRITNAHLFEVRVPRFRVLPSLETVLVDRNDLPSAGAGETPLVAVAPAIQNAIFDASGVRLRGHPLAPDGLVRPGAAMNRTNHHGG